MKIHLFFLLFFILSKYSFAQLFQQIILENKDKLPLHYKVAEPQIPSSLNENLQVSTAPLSDKPRMYHVELNRGLYLDLGFCQGQPSPCQPPIISVFCTADIFIEGPRNSDHVFAKASLEHPAGLETATFAHYMSIGDHKIFHWFRIFTEDFPYYGPGALHRCNQGVVKSFSKTAATLPFELTQRLEIDGNRFREDPTQSQFVYSGVLASHPSHSRKPQIARIETKRVQLGKDQAQCEIDIFVQGEALKRWALAGLVNVSYQSDSVLMPQTLAQVEMESLSTLWPVDTVKFSLRTEPGPADILNTCHRGSLSLSRLGEVYQELYLLTSPF
jgi:hypothetical protein